MNLFTVSNFEILSMNKTDLVQRILELRDKFVMDLDIKNLCDLISNLSYSIENVASSNEKLGGKLSIDVNINAAI